MLDDFILYLIFLWYRGDVTVFVGFRSLGMCVLVAYRPWGAGSFGGVGVYTEIIVCIRPTVFLLQCDYDILKYLDLAAVVAAGRTKMNT